jgi:hypothetical protein
MQESDVELETKVKKYLRGEGANLETLKDKKLKTQLASREKLYGKSAKAAAKIEKVSLLLHLALCGSCLTLFPVLREDEIICCVSLFSHRATVFNSSGLDGSACFEFLIIVF